MRTRQQHIPTNWDDREKLREKGQFWTPDWVAEAMIAYVAKGEDLIFDPATGNGAFYEALKKLDKKRLKSFYGIDIDPSVLKMEVYRDKSCSIELRDFLKEPPSKRFKAIVANPPYIRHHRIEETTKAFLKNLATRITGIKIDGRAGYHIYFLLQALHLLDKGGRLAFIMPSDTCEGTFAQKLWNWITRQYCLDCVITFSKEATPFPSVDTNPIIFLIRNLPPKNEILWVKCLEPSSNELRKFVFGEFKESVYHSFQVVKRDLSEAITTGLSRPKQNGIDIKYRLKDFARVVRGIATGSNEFFFLTEKQANTYRIPRQFLKRAIGRTKDVIGNIITENDIETLELKNRPTYLLSIEQDQGGVLPVEIKNYLKKGVTLKLPDKPLIRQRKFWYKMEQREVPPILFAYLGRRNSRFIKNDAKVLPLTSFLCVFPKNNNTAFIDNLWNALNHPETLKNLHLIGKSYGSGAIKVEPRSLENLPIPDTIVQQFNLRIEYKVAQEQLRLFQEKKASYKASSTRKRLQPK